MKDGLVNGVQAEVNFVVTEAMCPGFGGEIVHRVCSTWTLVHQMEVAGRKVLAPFLEAHEEGIGSHASCDHTGPAAVGETVKIIATAAEVSERALVCECAAYRGDRKIAAGKTVQKVYPRAVLERLLARGKD